MSWITSLEKGDAKRTSPDPEKAKSLKESAQERLKFCDSLKITDSNASYVFTDYYESLRMLCESILIREGFKIYNHVAITDFLKDYIKREHAARIFDQSRELRNNINYYGKRIPASKAIELITKIKGVFNELLLV